MKQIPNKSFYYIRHGETEVNVQNLLCGSDWDAELTDKGIQQAIDVANNIFSKINKIRHVLNLSSC